MSYMDRLRALKAEKPLPDEPTKPTKPGFEGFDGTSGRHVFQKSAPCGIPADLVAGLTRLRGRQPPRISNPAVWSEVVADATRLIDEGWATKALGLGWSVLDLFGVSPDGYEQGLAVWIGGRPLVLLDEHSAIARDDGWRDVFNRRDRPGMVLLWELGK